MPKIEVEDHVYPEISVQVCVGDDALTVDQAKDLLGWESEQGKIKFGDSYTIIDEEKKKVRCRNNTKNRPLNEEWSRTLAQDILNRRWKINLETIIIGWDGQVLSGQHRLIGLILASQMWAANKHWREKWKTEPVIETLVAFGADESEECTRTLDNVRPRTLSDVLYMSDAFGHHKPKDRKVIVRIIDYAVRLLWQRTGVTGNEYVSRRTHSESLDFISRHPRIITAAKHIYEEDASGSIRSYISMGYAAGLLYLMAASEDSRDTYLSGEFPNEEQLGLAKWDEACEFWTDFAQNRLGLLKPAMKPEGDDGQARSVTPHEQLALAVKAWDAWTKGKKIDGLALKLKYTSKNDVQVLDECPLLGGIDVGMIVKNDDEEEDEMETPAED